MKLTDEILKIGVEKCMFIVGFQPIRSAFGISYTDSSDEYVNLPAIIDETRYKIKDNYKITLRCTIPIFGSHNFYISDLSTMIESGHANMYSKSKCLPINPNWIVEQCIRVPYDKSVDVKMISIDNIPELLEKVDFQFLEFTETIEFLNKELKLTETFKKQDNQVYVLIDPNLNQFINTRFDKFSKTIIGD